MFSEAKIQLNEQWSITGGVRFEQGISKMSGQIGYYPTDKIPFDLGHQFPLFGGWYAISVE